MKRNALETLLGYGMAYFGKSNDHGVCVGQKDYPGVLVDKLKEGRNEALYQETLRALNSAKPGEIPVVRTNYVVEHGRLSFSGYTYTHLSKR